MCVCGIKHHHVHIGALQKKKKSYLQGSEKDHPLHSPPYHNTHTAEQPGPPTAQISAFSLRSTLHTQIHPHTCDSLERCSKCQEQGTIMTQCH